MNNMTIPSLVLYLHSSAQKTRAQKTQAQKTLYYDSLIWHKPRLSLCVDTCTPKRHPRGLT